MQTQTIKLLLPKIAHNAVNPNKGLYLLFLVWPFAAFVIALRHFSVKASRNIIYLFLILYGYTFIIGNEGIDANRYALRLKQSAEQPLSAFWDIIGGIYAYDTSVDIVEPCIRFLVSRVTDHHSLLFAAYAAVFGFFYLKSISALHDRHRSTNVNALVFFVFFSTIIPIFFINNFRFWTAAWMFFYGTYHVVLFKKSRFLWVSLAASLVHFTFLSANAVLLVYFFIGNRNFLYYPLLISSFILPDFVFTFLPQIADFFGGAIQDRIANYTNESYMLSVSDSLLGTRWFIQWSGKLIFYYLCFSILFLKIKYKKETQLNELKNLFSFMLLFLSYVNFFSRIPWAVRFFSVFSLFAVMFIFIVFSEIQQKKWHILTIVGLFPILLSAAISFRLGAETFNFIMFIPTPLLVISENLTLAELLFK